MTTAAFFKHFTQKLQSIYDAREAENIADWIFEDVTHLKKWERREERQDLSPSQLRTLEQYLSELLEHKPVQYVLGHAWFYKRKFFVNENVLIPRPETEELVKWIVDDLLRENKIGSEAYEILDIGTGSGCIAISLKKELPAAKVSAIDVSDKAVDVAKKNAAELNAEVDFKKIDFLHEVAISSLSQYEVIVSNPPYIPEKEKELLSKNVARFEPAAALFVSDSDPFIFYRRIASFAKSHLRERGSIYVETHENYSTEVAAIFSEGNFYTEIKKDIYGKERMIKAVPFK